MSRRRFLKASAGAVLTVALTGAGGAGYARDIEPEWLQISRVHPALANLSLAFEGYRIVQISDIHMGDWMTHERLLDAVNSVNALHPDLVSITGDFVTNKADPFAESLISALGTLSASDGVVAVLGNHDQTYRAATIRRVLRESKITDLSNNVRTMVRGRDMLHLAGVDDVWYGLNDLDLVLRKLPTQGAAILLAHEPDYADESSAAGRFAMQMSGHSHGGQVVVPFVGPTNLPHLGRKYHTGAYDVNGMFLYTNRGLGMVKPHVRFNCRPEITLFTLHSALSS